MLFFLSADPFYFIYKWFVETLEMILCTEENKIFHILKLFREKKFIIVLSYFHHFSLAFIFWHTDCGLYKQEESNVTFHVFKIYGTKTLSDCDILLFL